MPYGNPILAGNTLARTAMQSQDFVAGVSGWAVYRDGSAEFNNVTVRGDIIITDPDGSKIEILSGDGGRIRFYPETVVGATVTDPGSINSSNGGPYFYNTINTPDGTIGGLGVLQGSLFMASSQAGGFPYPGFPSVHTYLEWNGDGLFHGDVHTDDGIRVGGDAVVIGSLTVDGFEAMRGQSAIELVSFAAAVSNSTAVNFPTAFPVGVVPVVDVSIVSGVAATARWNVRPINITNTGFTIFSFKTDAADAANAWANIPVQWRAMYPIP